MTGIKRCSICKVIVNFNNYEKHLRKVHGITEDNGINVTLTKNRENTSTKDSLLSNGDSLSQDFINEILSIVISNLSSQKCNSNVSALFTENQLKLNKKVKKRLNNIISNAKKDNFLDTLLFTDFLTSIDSKKARIAFKNNSVAKANQLKKKKNKKKNKTKQDKAAELKPLAPSNLPKPSAKELLQESRGIKVIGLGVESIVNIPRVKSADVQIDKNTSNDKITDKSILYAAGWTINGPFSKN